MKNLKQILQIGLIPALIGVAALAQATDGVPGANSTGTMALSVTVPNIIVIKNVVDPAAVTFTGSADVNFTTSVCVGTNGAAGYTITASSAYGVGGPFALSDATATHSVAYNVAWAATAGATTGTAFSTSGTTQTFSTGPVSNLSCATNDATAVITVPAANLQLVPAGTYTDTLSLTVAPL